MYFFIPSAILYIFFFYPVPSSILSLSLFIYIFLLDVIVCGVVTRIWCYVFGSFSSMSCCSTPREALIAAIARRVELHQQRQRRRERCQRPHADESDDEDEDEQNGWY